MITSEDPKVNKNVIALGFISGYKERVYNGRAEVCEKGKNELSLAPWVILPAEFLMSAIKIIIKHKNVGGGDRQCEQLQFCTKPHLNYLTIPGPYLTTKGLSSSLLPFSALYYSHVGLCSFCNDRSTQNIRSQSCLGRFDINCTEHCYSEHRAA